MAAVPDKVNSRTLRRLMDRYGDLDRIAAALGVSEAELARWIEGKELPPHEVFLRALELAFSDAGRARPKKK